MGGQQNVPDFIKRGAPEPLAIVLVEAPAFFFGRGRRLDFAFHQHADTGVILSFRAAVFLLQVDVVNSLAPRLLKQKFADGQGAGGGSNRLAGIFGRMVLRFGKNIRLRNNDTVDTDVLENRPGLRRDPCIRLDVAVIASLLPTRCLRVGFQRRVLIDCCHDPTPQACARWTDAVRGRGPPGNPDATDSGSAHSACAPVG